MPNTIPSEVEEIIVHWRKEFTTPNGFGERQLDQFCVSEYTRNTPIVQQASGIVQKHETWLRTTLTTLTAKHNAEKAEMVQAIVKLADQLEHDCNRDGDKGTEQRKLFKGFRNTIRDKFGVTLDTNN